MKATAISTPNIALIKYWGNRNNEWRLPAADSLSMTLDSPSVEITVEGSDVFTVRSFNPDGTEKELTETHVSRFQKTLETIQHYLRLQDINDPSLGTVSITVRSHIPPSVGLASSAAVFSCLGKALSGYLSDEVALSPKQVSVLARLGSGSAARSVMGGFVTLENGEGEDIGSAFARQVADEHHWNLHDIVVIPSHEEKKVGSTQGHAIAQTSPHFNDRIEAITNRRQKDCIDAILQKDFEKLQAVSEEDALDMHHVMETSDPPLKYLSDETHRIIKEITALRESEHLPVLYTMDAGPTVHLICPDEALEATKEFASAQTGCTVFETKVGAGSKIV